MSGCDYGNTRLRARYASCLDRADYEALIGAGGLDQMLGSLAAGIYASDVEAAVARYRGLRRVDETVRRHLEREYASTLSFYEGEERAALALVAERWDVRNLTALIRAQGSPGGASEVVRWLVAAGRIDAAALAELASQPSIRALVDLAIAWRIPDSDTAAALARALPDFDASGDSVVLEAAIHRAFASRLEKAYRERPEDAVPAVLHVELVALAVTLALRLWAARLAGEAQIDPASVVISSTIPLPVVESVGMAGERDDVAAILVGCLLPPGFDGALDRWRRHGDLPLLADELGVAVVRIAQAALRRDPLGLGVPVGYLWVKESEGRNLRLIGRGHVHGLDPTVVGERLTIP